MTHAEFVPTRGLLEVCGFCANTKVGIISNRMVNSSFFIEIRNNREGQAEERTCPPSRQPGTRNWRKLKGHHRFQRDGSVHHIFWGTALLLSEASPRNEHRGFPSLHPRDATSPTG